MYVTGLPLDLTNVEYQDVMSKCGLIMHDPISHKPKLKLYRNKDGNLKGDGLCCYIKVCMLWYYNIKNFIYCCTSVY